MNVTYLRLTWNHLRNNKYHTFLNILGLATGLFFFVHLLLYISYENGYDSFFKTSNLVYRINYDVAQDGVTVLHSAKTPRRLFRVVKEEIPEIKFSALTYVENVLVNYNGHLFSDQYDLWVEGDFAEIFELEMIRGVAQLNDAWKCIISESKAYEIFGNEDPIGKVILVNEGMQHEITGIYKDLPSNSHIHSDYFMPVRTWVESGGIPAQENFIGAGWWTYIKIKEGIDPVIVEKSLSEISKKYLTHLVRQNRIGTFTLQPLARLHFSTDRDGELGISIREKTIEALSLIAALILVVIWMNYINLSTALTRKRINVFAIYKQMGASKYDLFLFSITESILINFAAISLTILIFVLSSKLFNRLINIPVSDGYINYSRILTITVLIIISGILITSLLSAIPSMKVKPALKQQRKLSDNGSSLLLVAVQFFISCFLIICSLIVAKQINFMQNADLGVNLNKVIVIKGAASTHTDSLRREHFNAFREEVLRNPEFRSGTASMNVPGEPVRFRSNNLALPDAPGELKREVNLGHIDDGYLDTYGLNLLEGGNFEQPFHLDSSKVILSESAVRLLGFDSPGKAVNRQLRIGNNLMTIKGVVNDFHHEGLKKPLAPMVFIHRHPFEFGNYSFRIQGNVQTALASLKTIWPKHYPNDPLNYFLSEEYFTRQYNEEVRLGRILTAFTFFAIIIASLGLFGLISYLTQQRTKEIGIRKINGAGIRDILFLFVSFFIKFGIAAFMIACPLSWIVMRKWLQGFAYQTTTDGWIFILAGVIAFTISILSIITQCYRAAVKNPVEALMYE